MTAPDLATPWQPQDELGMRLALDQALNAELAGEVPVGAVILHQGQVLATGYNRPITTHDPTAHAEIVALRQAAVLQQNYRLPDCTLYVTLEPCAMCAMAMMHARVRRVVFATADPKTGAAGSVLDLFALTQLNHQTQVQGGLLAEPAASLLRQFFARRRAEQKAEREGRRALLPEQAGAAQAGAAQATWAPHGLDSAWAPPAPAHPDKGATLRHGQAAGAPIPLGESTELAPDARLPDELAHLHLPPPRP